MKNKAIADKINFSVSQCSCDIVRTITLAPQSLIRRMSSYWRFVEICLDLLLCRRHVSSRLANHPSISVPLFGCVYPRAKSFASSIFSPIVVVIVETLSAVVLADVPTVDVNSERPDDEGDNCNETKRHKDH